MVRLLGSIMLTKRGFTFHSLISAKLYPRRWDVMDATKHRNQIMQNIKHSCLLVVLMLLSACASNVVVNGDIPKPLMQQLPLTAKLNFSEEFLNYTYVEQDKKRVIKSLDFGQAQAELFKVVFGSAFRLSEGNTTGTDIEITPKILSIQYSAPSETALNIYEVFVKYRITISDANQQKLADWVIKGYGKTPTAFLKGADAAFNAATNVALRDVGAQISIGLPLQASIKALMLAKSFNRDGVSTLPTTSPTSPTSLALPSTASGKEFKAARIKALKAARKGAIKADGQE